MTIFVTWQLRVTLDSIRNSCDVRYWLSLFCLFVRFFVYLLYLLVFGNSIREIFWTCNSCLFPCVLAVRVRQLDWLNICRIDSKVSKSLGALPPQFPIYFGFCAVSAQPVHVHIIRNSKNLVVFQLDFLLKQHCTLLIHKIILFKLYYSQGEWTFGFHKFVVKKKHSLYFLTCLDFQIIFQFNWIYKT